LNTTRFEEGVDDAAWDALVLASPQGNSFLLSSTLNALARNEHPVAVPRRVMAFAPSGDCLAGWAVLRRRRFGMRYCSSFPLFYAGPLLGPEMSAPDQTSNRTALLARLADVMMRGLDACDTEAAPELPDVRGLLYAGCRAETVYAHLWPEGDAEAVPRFLNRAKRREMKGAAGCHAFDWLDIDAQSLEHFDRLHNRTLEKFKWVPPKAWRLGLLANMRDLGRHGICRIFAAVPSSSGHPLPCAMVSVLICPLRQTAWLWRVACESNDPGLVPALYVKAAQAVKSERGPAWRINFGGSPRLSLSLFKDYLGAQAVPHWRIRWMRHGWKSLAWNGASALREQARRTMTQWGLLRGLPLSDNDF